jgi:hypothetical protein
MICPLPEGKAEDNIAPFVLTPGMTSLILISLFY